MSLPGRRGYEVSPPVDESECLLPTLAEFADFLFRCSVSPAVERAHQYLLTTYALKWAELHGADEHKAVSEACCFWDEAHLTADERRAEEER